MTALLVLLNVVLIAALIPLAVNVARIRMERRQRGLFGPWPIPRCALEEFDEIFRPTPLGPSIETEVRFVGRGPMEVPGGTSDAEAWILAVLAKRALRLFEFGTCTGKTAYLWARNSPPDATVTTLTLAPDDQRVYEHAEGDDSGAARTALDESHFSRFLYSSTATESKIDQRFGDSKEFNGAEFQERCDLVFVNGSHAYSYVRSDSRKAIRMVRPGCIVLWHAYHGPRWQPDVFRALNELSEELPLVHLAGTKLFEFRKPRAD